MRKDIDFDQVRKTLDTQRTTNQQRLDQELKKLQAYSDSNADLLDAATKTFVQERRMGWINYLKGRLSQIEEATRRLETGQYGICTYCGNDIELDRLQAKPYAKFCVKCKNKKERGRI